MGSKNKIASWVVDHLPDSDAFVDAFAGGCAVTHRAMLSGKYKKVIVNDIGDATKLFIDAINGRYTGVPPWVSREEFFLFKESDPYIKYCWSFGSNGRDYLYSVDREPVRKAIHGVLVSDDSADARKKWREFCHVVSDAEKAYTDAVEAVKSLCDAEGIATDGKTPEQMRDALVKRRGERMCSYLEEQRRKASVTQKEVNALLGANGMAGHYFGRSQWQAPSREAYAQMQTIIPSLADDYDDFIKPLHEIPRIPEKFEMRNFLNTDVFTKWERIKSLRALRPKAGMLTVCNFDYRELEVPVGSVIYCDPPYIGTKNAYTGGVFDYDSFYRWIHEQKELVIVSELTAPPGCVPVASRPLNYTISGTKNDHRVMETLFVPEEQVGEYYDRLNFMPVPYEVGT